MVGLAYYRQITKKTLENLARAVGTTRQTIRNWENGSYPIPKERYQKLEEVTGVPADLFVKPKISELDKIKIQRCIISQDIDESLVDSDGEQLCTSPDLIEQSQYLSVKEAEETEIQRIRDCVRCYKHRNNDPEEYRSECLQRINIYKKFTDLISDCYENNRDLYYVKMMLFILDKFYNPTNDGDDDDDKNIQKIISILLEKDKERKQRRDQIQKLMEELDEI